ncbi:MAG: ArsR family transcriptional regulator [Anaerolineaceae bacterium]|nr:MAG: ArsR family transcriptional regulator [Anaerolineaceae bacterium]
MEQDLIIFEMQAQLCQVLGHAIRLRIVHTLKEGPQCVNELVAALQNIPQPTVSRHLAVLRSAGIVSTRRQGMEIIYEIATPKIVGVCEMMRTILAERESQQLELLHRIQA